MAEKHPHQHPQGRLIVYYKTENGTKQPYSNNKAYIVAFYRGNIYTAKDDPLIKEFNELKAIFDKNSRGGYRSAMVLVINELNAQGCWYAFPVIRSPAEVNYLLYNFFRWGRIQESCKQTWFDIRRIRDELTKANYERDMININKRKGAKNNE